MTISRNIELETYQIREDVDSGSVEFRARSTEGKTIIEIINISVEQARVLGEALIKAADHIEAKNEIN